MFEQNKILTVFEIHVMELFREVSKQIRMESLPIYLLEMISVHIIQE